MPSGSKLGVMGIDITPGPTAKCWVFSDRSRDKKVCALGKGTPRLWHRQKEGQAERSMHPRCGIDKSCLNASHRVTGGHLSHSIIFLNRNTQNDSFSADLKEIMTQLLDVLVLLSKDCKGS